MLGAVELWPRSLLRDRLNERKVDAAKVRVPFTVLMTPTKIEGVQHVLG